MKKMGISEFFTVLGIFPVLVYSSYDGWTIWYNTDKPYAVGDIELYDKIKQGYYVCGSKTPTKAECRAAGTNSVFTYETSAVAPDYLFNPCTTSGVVCRNKDQTDQSCNDYEIRFFCPKYDNVENSDDTVTNFWMIALVGAGCIIAPLLCVVVLQCYREVRIRRISRQRLRNRHILTGQVENSLSSTNMDFETAQPPPSYQTLFGNESTEVSSRSNENLINSTRTSGIRHSLSRLFRLSNTQVSSQNNSRENTSDAAPVSQISQGAIYPTDMQTPTNELNSHERAVVHTSGRRFPGMHISIFDAFSAPSDDIVTPPPTYKDAIVIIGECPPKYSENADCSQTHVKENTVVS